MFKAFIVWLRKHLSCVKDSVEDVEEFLEQIEGLASDGVSKI